jgi:hypothetical protein
MDRRDADERLENTQRRLRELGAIVLCCSDARCR